MIIKEKPINSLFEMIEEIHDSCVTREKLLILYAAS